MQYDVLELFDEEKYKLENFNHAPGNDEHLGEITIEFINTASDTADFTNNTLDDIFSSGTGKIIEITFLALNAQDSTTTISIKENNTNVMGFNLSDETNYLFDLNYWTILESLIINF